jgi:hypothetical protein
LIFYSKHFFVFLPNWLEKNPIYLLAIISKNLCVIYFYCMFVGFILMVIVIFKDFLFSFHSLLVHDRDKIAVKIHEKSTVLCLLINFP